MVAPRKEIHQQDLATLTLTIVYKEVDQTDLTLPSAKLVNFRSLEAKFKII